VFYQGTVRSFAAPIQKSFHHYGITFGFEINRTVVLITDKTFYAQLIGNGFGAIAVKYTVYFAGYFDIEMLFNHASFIT